MVESSTVSYYLCLIGGSFTVLTGTVPFTSGWAYPGYLSGEAQFFLFLVISGSGIVSLTFGHRLGSRPRQRQLSSVIVIVMSLVAWWGIIASRALLVSDFSNAGPFLSFAGGIAGLSGSVGQKSST